MGLREWLMLLGGLVVIAIALDGLRRIRRQRRLGDEDDEDWEDPEEASRRAQIARELPNGGARVLSSENESPWHDRDPLFDDVEVFDDDPVPVLKHPVSQESDSALPSAGSSRRKPLRPEDLFTQPLPDTSDDGPFDEPSEAMPQSSRQPQFYQQEAPASADHEHIVDAGMEADEQARWDDMRARFRYDPSFMAASAQPHDQTFADDTPDESIASVSEVDYSGSVDHTDSNEVARESVAEAHESIVDEHYTAPPAHPEPEPEPEPSHQDRIAAALAALEKRVWSEAEEFLTINVNAREGVPFNGVSLQQLMDAVGMACSENGFFHRTRLHQGKAHLEYSMVNMFAPGRFDAHGMDETFETQGVVFVMALPGPMHPMEALDEMVGIAHHLVRNFDGELQDEQRSVLTSQTVEHYRQRIQEFERKTHLAACKSRQS
ncbi:hypothetical protein BFW38_11910 [Terasakiispira papahanaumokuakeensis]|uniref:Cell division protein ZipA n=1 Tax=Terasakiispira papahanaumokuakeensis TaxID=197479 RepID=A0A1E2VBT2_9GAMM|nr:cell division protein ZipA C-terminal FtsZ-binding domain-containing protein [Terasakiispira papahanaumokuakeensis]ODC04125.1 hypothetical protein BFW38_11910 [Terasakiispira papahanaumokuakeensis]